MTRRRQSRRPVPAKASSRRRWLAIGAVVGIAVVAVAALIVLSRDGDDGGEGSAPLSTLPAGVTAQGKTLGSTSAPVTLDDFSDFLCPHCHDWALGGLRRVIERYVASGQARVVFHNFPVFGEPAVQAAVAAECAADQNAFWPYHDLLFARQDAQARSSGFGQGRLLDMAERAGLDRDRFRGCLGEQAARDAVASDAAGGRARGVRSTPTMFVNGVKIEGNNEQAVIDAIERALGR